MHHAALKRVNFSSIYIYWVVVNRTLYTTSVMNNNNPQTVDNAISNVLYEGDKPPSNLTIGDDSILNAWDTTLGESIARKVFDTSRFYVSTHAAEEKPYTHVEYFLALYNACIIEILEKAKMYSVFRVALINTGNSHLTNISTHRIWGHEGFNAYGEVLMFARCILVNEQKMNVAKDRMDELRRKLRTIERTYDGAKMCEEELVVDGNYPPNAIAVYNCVMKQWRAKLDHRTCTNEYEKVKADYAHYCDQALNEWFNYHNPIGSVYKKYGQKRLKPKFVRSPRGQHIPMPYSRPWRVPV